MAVTQAQYDRLLVRITALEQVHNDMVVAISQFITLQQMTELQVVTTADLADLSEQVTALDSRVTAIEEEPLQ